MMKCSMFFEHGPLPPPTLHPLVIHMIGVPRASPFFSALPLLCIVLNANQRTGRPGNEANLLSLGRRLRWVCLWAGSEESES